MNKQSRVRPRVRLAKVLLSTSAAVAALTVLVPTYGCGKDTVADTVNREKDREVQAAQNLMGEYQEVTGTYKGSVVMYTSEHPACPDQEDQSKCGEHIDIVADIEMDLENQDGLYVPQPGLQGSFALYNNDLLDSKGRPTKKPLAFRAGKYSKAFGKFVVDIYGDSGAISQTIRCKVPPGVDHLDCTLRALAGYSDNKVNFTVYRVQ